MEEHMIEPQGIVCSVTFSHIELKEPQLLRCEFIILRNDGLLAQNVDSLDEAALLSHFSLACGGNILSNLFPEDGL